MRHYCTYFDRNYLSRGLALIDSLRAQDGACEIVVLGMDAATETALRQLALPGVRVLPIAELTARHASLAAARADRSTLEFYFTCTSWLMRDLLPQLPAGELLTYLDADLYFFSSPETIFTEIGAASVAITPHRFPTSLAHLERYGKFNVGWVSLRHDATGLACAADWADKCAAWCFNTLEATRYADQKYLDTWATDFPGTVSLSHPGINAAPWNIKDATLSADPAGVQLNGQALVFYHFHALRHLGRQLYDPSLHKYDATLSAGLRELVYLPYLRHVLRHEPATADTAELIPTSAPEDSRNGAAVVHLLEQLRASELDRAQRLSAIENAASDMAKTVSFLHAVEADSAERLASIHFYQEKLKTAYSDHERNMAYLKTLEAEIAAHVKVSADKDIIIATLAEQLRASTTPRP